MGKFSKFKVYCVNSGRKIGSIPRKIWAGLTRRDERGNYLLFDSPAVLIGWSLFLEFVLEALSRHSVLDAVVFLVKAPYAFAFSALMIFFTLSITLATPIKAFLQALISLLWLAMGITNCILLLKRVTPFTVNDLSLITSVFRIFSVYLSIIEIVLIVIAILAAIAGLVFLAIKAPKGKIKLKSAISSILISALLLPGGYYLGLGTHVLSDQFPNIADAYDQYGLPYCFFIGIIDRGISQPKDYSEETINQILSSLGKEQESISDDSPNVIYLQLESFFDVNYLTNVQFSENPIPYFTQLKSDALSGFLTVPSIGAGTVNTEFEILTGMSISYFGAGEYPYKTVLMNGTCESAAYNLKELGYTAHAIHNYEGTFYDRNLVYQNLGFDTFTSLEYMANVVYNDSGSWPKDEMLVDEILSALSSTDTKDFIMAVSVQGHGKYPPISLPEDYQSPIDASFIDGRLEGGISDIAALSYYVGQLREMDEFLRKLVEELNNYPEKVILVMYGDHLPSLSISHTDLKNENVFQTEYVILTNYGAEQHYPEVGDLYSYQLGAIAMDVAGIHRGVLTRYHQNLRNTKQYMDGLQELEYDMLYGDRYVYSGNKDRYLPVDTQMGIRPITITDVVWNEQTGLLTVSGTNFTDWSKIEVNGKVYTATERGDKGTLTLLLDSQAPESIRVVQYSPDGVILSGTEVYLYALPTE
jgi:phosphoglycerol transferase MdoB-like AlkP superfamily enzyme